MPFTTATVAVPSDNGRRSVKRGNLLVRIAPGPTTTYAIVVVTNLNTNAQWAWQVETPSSSHLFTHIATPDIDPATGLIWFAATSTSTDTSSAMFVSVNPSDGETNYYPTSEPYNGAPNWVAVAGDYVVLNRSLYLQRFHIPTAALAIAATTNGRPNPLRPAVYDGEVFMRFNGYNNIICYDPATNSAPTAVLGANGTGPANSSLWVEGSKAYGALATGSLLVIDMVAKTAQQITVPAGFLGAPIVMGADGKIYSKPLATIVGCFDPVTLEVAAATVATSTSLYAFRHNDLVHFCVGS